MGGGKVGDEDIPIVLILIDGRMLRPVTKHRNTYLRKKMNPKKRMIQQSNQLMMKRKCNSRRRMKKMSYGRRKYHLHPHRDRVPSKNWNRT